MPQTLAERIVALEGARDALISGKSRVEVRVGDEAIRYQPADLAALERRIKDLQAEARMRNRRAIGVSFR